MFDQVSKIFLIIYLFNVNIFGTKYCRQKKDYVIAFSSKNDATISERRPATRRRRQVPVREVEHVEDETSFREGEHVEDETNVREPEHVEDETSLREGEQVENETNVREPEHVEDATDDWEGDQERSDICGGTGRKGRQVG
jgi:hypothetical protein